MKFKILVLLIILGAISCGTNTQIVGAWTSDDLPPGNPYEKVFIAAITPNTNVQNAVENNLASAARERGIEASTSATTFAKSFTKSNQPSKTEILDKVRAENADAIFTVTLLDKESETRYVPGSTYYSPMSYGGYYGSFYSYYNTVYPMTYDPGYYKTDKIYFIESNLYDANTEELIWSAQSKTVNPSNIDSFARDYTQAMIDELIKDGVLKK
ncbi:hypothetical protein ML462_01025 [Gramella lutea]|uniref:DUF4136 domain-containing protein n=1 Tax=Christiangramia lutea TaxID=1607951 RepID=A0A9X2A961_9FLAO|nr:hypothetical protein [Christiangramia lutea]MCH4821741.1 hypothetical protein [Christiangramia lutea]